MRVLQLQAALQRFGKPRFLEFNTACGQRYE